jgi:hypothetical protein
MRIKIHESPALPRPNDKLLLTWAGPGATDQYVTSNHLCKAMVDDWVGAVPKNQTINTAGNTTLRNLYLDLSERIHAAQTVGFTETLKDYFYGAGLAINPLPSEPATFYTSDREALLSDWIVTRSDIERVWNTCTTVRNFDWQIDGGVRRNESGTSAEPERAAATSARDHTSGS